MAYAQQLQIVSKTSLPSREKNEKGQQVCPRKQLGKEKYAYEHEGHVPGTPGCSDSTNTAHIQAALKSGC